MNEIRPGSNCVFSIILRTIICIIAIHSTAGCRKEEYKQELIPLTLTVEKEYRFDVLASEAQLAGTDDPGSLYVSFFGNRDSDCEVYRMGRDLEVLGKYIIKRGQGPGEARNPHIYGGDEKSILVYAPPDFKFIEFDRDFKPLNQFRVKDYGVPLFSGAKYFQEKRLVIDGYHYPYRDFYKDFISLYAIKLREKDFAEEKKIFETYTYRVRKDSKNIIWAFPIHFTYFKGYIYILDKRDYRLTKIDLDGQVKIEKKIAFKSRQVDKDTRKRWIEAEFPNDPRTLQSYDYPDDIWPVNWLLPLGNGIAVARCDSYDPDIEPGPITADYFDADLNLLGQVQLPYFPYWNNPIKGHILVDKTIFYRDGKLYMLEERDEEWLLIRYGVKIGEIERQTGEKNGD